MNYINNIYILGIVLIFFIIFELVNLYRCDCKKKINNCFRLEFYGTQINHLIFFIFLGFFFPKYFLLTQFIGVLWEIIEYIYDKFIYKKLKLGCFSNEKKESPLYFNFVYKKNKKYINFIDKFFKIKRSNIHMFHYSVSEIVFNILGFMIGYYINKFSFKN